MENIFISQFSSEHLKEMYNTLNILGYNVFFFTWFKENTNKY